MNIGAGGPVPDTPAMEEMAVTFTQDMLDEQPPDFGRRLNILSPTFISCPPPSPTSGSPSAETAPEPGADPGLLELAKESGLVSRGRAVAVAGLAVWAAYLAGAVGVNGQYPAELVQQDVVVPGAVTLEIGEAGGAAVSMIRRYIIWCNNHAYDERLRRTADRANVA